jgi:small subunit ribosomal protein S1
VSEPEDEDFAALFERSTRSSETKRIGRGQTVEGTVVAIGREVAFVSVGGKGEATIDLAELKDEDGTLEVAVGDRIQAVVVSTEGGLTLSRRLARGAAGARQLEDAYRAGLAVEGKVVGPIKGGYEVRVAHARAFCPLSQIDIIRDTPPEQHVGRVYAFRITEYRDGGRSIVVSRRALLEDEQRAKAAEIRETIVAGAVLSGRVASVRDFGAFVDLGGGIQGLLHVSEMGWSRTARPEDLVKAGEPITVKVLRVDEDGKRISLGLKQLGADPWSTVDATYAVGDVLIGRVTRLSEFGAFVELAPGIEALAHVSTFPPGQANNWTHLVPVGTAADFEILTIDPDKRRMGVALVPEFSSRSSSSHQRDDADARQDDAAAAERFGSSLADKLRGAFERK